MNWLTPPDYVVENGKELDGDILACPHCENCTIMSVKERNCVRCGIPEDEHFLSYGHFFVRSMGNMDIPNPKDSRGMLRVVGVGDKVVGIQFRHIKTKTYVGQKEKSLRITHCGLFELEADENAAPIKISYGVAKCAEGDNFSRERGRKLALARALESGDHQFASDVVVLDTDGVTVLRKGATAGVKSLRETVWKAYFDRIPKKVNPEEPTPVVQETVDGVIVKPVEEPVVLH